MKRRTYACFVPNDKPKALPPPGHPDWDEYEPPSREKPARELTYEECVLTWMIQRAFRDTGGGYYPEVREAAYSWLMFEDDEEPGTFSWACSLLGLRMEVLIDTWQRVRGKIQRPTMEDKVWWNRRDARNREVRQSRVNRSRARKRLQNKVDGVAV